MHSNSKFPSNSKPKESFQFAHNLNLIDRTSLGGSERLYV